MPTLLRGPSADAQGPNIAGKCECASFAVQVLNESVIVHAFLLIRSKQA